MFYGTLQGQHAICYEYMHFTLCTCSVINLGLLADVDETYNFGTSFGTTGMLWLCSYIWWHKQRR